MSSASTDAKPLPLEMALRVDAACNAFELALQAGRRGMVVTPVFGIAIHSVRDLVSLIQTVSNMPEFTRCRWFEAACVHICKIKSKSDDFE